MQVVLEGEVLGPKLDAGAHDVGLRLEGGDKAPIKREGPEYRAEQRGEGRDEAERG